MLKSELAYLMHINGYRLEHIAKKIYGSKDRRARKAAWKLVRDGSKRKDRFIIQYFNEYDSDHEPIYHPHAERLRKAILTIGSLLYDPPILALMEYAYSIASKLNGLRGNIEYMAAAYVAWYLTLLEHEATLKIQELREITRILIKEDQVERFNRAANKFMRNLTIQSILL